MLYYLLKIPAQIVIKIYCKKIDVSNADLLKHDGPILLACNHPNSFLDAIVLCTLLKKPIYSLARGDAFNRKWAAKILSWLKILPVYREREGIKQLDKNYETFDSCINIFKQNGIVLIFSEALCINEWHLRPLRKGTARLALTAWKQDIPLKILPVGINYNNFKKFGKHIKINFGSYISSQQFSITEQTNGSLHNLITASIQEQLGNLVYEIEKTDLKKREEIFSSKISNLQKILLTMPAILGWLIHFPFYYPLYKIVYSKASKTDHYDSIIVSASFLLYPFYLLISSLCIFLATKNSWSFCGFLIFPLLAYCWVKWKK